MTVEPTSTRANRINSDCLDWSYIGISFTVEQSAGARRAGPASTAHSWALRGPLCGCGVDGRGRRVRVRLGGPRQCLRVDILPDARQLAVSNRDGEDPVVLERLVRGFDPPPREADDQNPV